MIAQVSERVSSGKKNNATLYHRIKNNLQLKNLFNRPFRDATTILNSVVSKLPPYRQEDRSRTNLKRPRERLNN